MDEAGAAMGDARVGSPGHPRRRPAARLLAWLLVSAPVTFLALVLLAVAVTLEGRVAAVCALAVVAVVALALVRRPRPSLVAWAVALAAFALLVGRAPSGDAPPRAALRAVYLRGGGASRLAPTNLVPEVDQLVLATYLVWLPDPVMNWSSAARLRGAILRAYARAADAGEGRALGSAMGDAITDRDTGRLFVYEPPHAPGERRPAVLFLHGSAGSWKGYFYGQVALARPRRIAVAQPSFGFGDWSRSGGLAAVERARAWLAAQPWIDASRIYLVCLSNGGRAATRVMQAGPARYRGVAFVSAVIEPRVLDAKALDPSWRDVPTLVMHGAIDDRIPLDYLDEGVAALTDQGVAVTRDVVAGEDHYLIFTDPRRLERTLGDWLDAAGAR